MPRTRTKSPAPGSTSASTIWGDSAVVSGPEIYEFGAASPTVTYSCVEGGHAGAGNVDADPLFVDPDGADDTLGTVDDDLRLGPGSPCIDCADGDAAPAADLDGDARHDDSGVDDTGVGTPVWVDMGAYEFQGSTVSISSIDLTTAPAGDIVTIYGGGFMVGATVDFGAYVSPTVTFVDSGELTAVVPDGTGTVDVTVTNPDTYSATLPAAFLFAPRIDLATPGVGPTAGGTLVTITGLNFINTPTDPGVWFGTVQASSSDVIWISATEMTVLTPPAATYGPVDVRVVNPDTGEDTMSNGFTYSGGPGDLNGDGFVNVFDLSIVTGHFGQDDPSDPSWDPRADPDGNDAINIFDLSVVTSNFGNVY